MGLNHQSRVGSFLVGLGAWLLRGLVKLQGWTCKVDVVAGHQHLEALLAEPRPVILSFWHNRSFLAAPFLLEKLHRAGVEVTMLASHSRDGELVTQVVKRLEMRTVRGSASRGGRQALRAIYRAIVRHRSSPIMIPDGPRGPLYDFKIGVVILGQMSQAPILPLGFATPRFFRIRSWDRMFVPLPFSRIALVVGEPQTLGRGLSAEELEAERERLQAMLDDVTREAEHAVGATDVLRD